MNLDNLNHSRRPFIVGVGGFTSEVGKTTLLCELLKAFPNWEAIKTTRGHYRSCGKDPDVCCVSDLLGDEPVVRSGRELTYAVGKDTGRYWDAGAENVHWVIATDNQVEKGIEIALERVEAEGVFVEGNSFTSFVDLDYFVMVARSDSLKIKTTAKRALDRVSAFYVSSNTGSEIIPDSFIGSLRQMTGSETPVFTGAKFGQLVSSIRENILPKVEYFQANLPR